jgi:hypothetical protein
VEKKRLTRGDLPKEKDEYADPIKKGGTEAMKNLRGKFTEKEKAWIKEYFKAHGNATEATREVYGGTSASCRVKGFRKAQKFKGIIHEIIEKNLDEMEFHGLNGVDFYLETIERLNEMGRPQRLMMLCGNNREG